MKVLIATEKPFANNAIEQMAELVEAENIELLLLEKYTDKAELLAAVADVDGLIVRSDKVDKELLDAAKNLKVVVRAGAGYDTIDLVEATAHEVIVMNTPGQNANAVAELVFGLLIHILRNGFDGSIGSELKGRTIGLHAFGNVGRSVATIAQGFGMKVKAYDPFLHPDRMVEVDVEPVESIEDLYSTCDIVSIHIPVNDNTRESINYDLLSLMPTHGVLVNTARKELIDEEGLFRLMKERNDLSFIADVKPDRADEFVENFPKRVLFTAKKMGAQTEEANLNAGVAAAKQVVNYLIKEDDFCRVN